ncbi:MAG TPA: aldose 1-epimerase family protein, partial [Sphingomonas sp.]|nr:aldose 1-epimerase family protein [Sphingomonas sp.]
FARGSRFEVVAHEEARATFRLEANDHTRKLYPFEFRLDVTHSLDGATLTIAAEASNRGEEPMPVGIGFHPALRWPLPGTGSQSKEHHILHFDASEPEPLRSVSPDGLIAAAERPTPVAGDELTLRDSLFTHDALVFDRINSRGLWYGVPGQPGVRVDFADMPMLGVWMKPGAGYLCIEPWHSRADDEGYAGAFKDKPGVVTIAPGESRRFAIELTFGVML